MHAVAAKPGALVEAVPTGRGSGHPADQRRAWIPGAAHGRAGAPGARPRAGPAGRTAPRWRGHAGRTLPRRAGAVTTARTSAVSSGAPREDAAIESVEPCARPPPCSARASRDQQERDARSRASERATPNRDRARRASGHAPAGARRFASDEAGARAQSASSVRGEPDRARGHGATSSRSCSSRAGPMPGTRRAPPPRRSRRAPGGKSRIFCAVTGPTPGSASSCSSVAVVEAHLDRRARTCRSGRPAPPSAARRGTTTCAPSASGAARLISASSAFASRRRRAATASAMRLPSREPVEARSADRADDVDRRAAVAEPAAPRRRLARRDVAVDAPASHERPAPPRAACRRRAARRRGRVRRETVNDGHVVNRGDSGITGRVTTSCRKCDSRAGSRRRARAIRSRQRSEAARRRARRLAPARVRGRRVPRDARDRPPRSRDAPGSRRRARDRLRGCRSRPRSRRGRRAARRRRRRARGNSRHVTHAGVPRTAQRGARPSRCGRAPRIRPGLRPPSPRSPRSDRRRA